MGFVVSTSSTAAAAAVLLLRSFTFGQQTGFFSTTLLLSRTILTARCFWDGSRLFVSRSLGQTIMAGGGGLGCSSAILLLLLLLLLLDVAAVVVFSLLRCSSTAVEMGIDLLGGDDKDDGMTSFLEVVDALGRRLGVVVAVF
jgi:hypothetical protein